MVYGDAGAGDQMLCTAGEDGRTLLWRVADLVAAADEATSGARSGSGSVRSGGGSGGSGKKGAMSVKPVEEYANPQESKARGGAVQFESRLPIA